MTRAAKPSLHVHLLCILMFVSFTASSTRFLAFFCACQVAKDLDDDEADNLEPVPAAATPAVCYGTLKKRCLPYFAHPQLVTRQMHCSPLSPSRSPKNKLVWQARFFVLHNASLLYYKSEDTRSKNKNAIQKEQRLHHFWGT